MKHVKLFEAFVTNMNEASKFKKGDTITSKVNDNDLEYSLYDLTNDVDGITMSKGTKFEIVKFNKKEETVELQGVNGDENEYSLEVTDLQFFESYKSVNEASKFKKGDTITSKVNDNGLEYSLYDLTNDVDGISLNKGTEFKITGFNKKEETVELQGVNDDENEYSLVSTDLQFFESFTSTLNEAKVNLKKALKTLKSDGYDARLEYDMINVTDDKNEYHWDGTEASVETENSNQGWSTDVTSVEDFITLMTDDELPTGEWVD